MYLVSILTLYEHYSDFLIISFLRVGEGGDLYHIF